MFRLVTIDSENGAVNFFCKICLLITKHNITDNVYIRLRIYKIYTDLLIYTFNQICGVNVNVTSQILRPCFRLDWC